jgi:hypothetical protein
MADVNAKITVDDIVAAAGSGALRAMSARGGTAGDRELSIEKLVASGFGVRFEIWAGGWPGPWGPNGLPGGLPGKGGTGGIG